MDKQLLELMEKIEKLRDVWNEISKLKRTSSVKIELFDDQIDKIGYETRGKEKIATIIECLISEKEEEKAELEKEIEILMDRDKMSY